MGIIELTVTSCIHMIRVDPKTLNHRSIGSGVIIKYKERYFICTVAHFSDYPEESTGIITGSVEDNQTEIYQLGEFSYISSIEFEEIPDSEDLIFCIENPDESGRKLDIAFKEIQLLENILQDERVFDLGGVGKITVNKGGKSFIIIDEDYEIDQGENCSFFGRIKPKYEDEVLKFQEALYWNLPIKAVSKHFVELDLGAPINDHTRFQGCSGAPIIDTRGRLIGLVTSGSSDPSQSSIFGFRFDKVKEFIDLMYFPHH